MKTIFKKLGEWDMFNCGLTYLCPSDENDEGITLKANENSTDSGVFFSLADLLANKSWCKAVWSKSDSINICPLCSYHNYTGIEIFEHYSFKAFVILQQQDEKACITYIKKTMI